MKMQYDIKPYHQSLFDHKDLSTVCHFSHKFQGCHASGKSQENLGKLNFFQGQRIVREFCKLSGKFGIVSKCQGMHCQGISKIQDSSQIS